MHSPVVARALQQAAGRLSRSSSGSSVEVQPSANTRSLRQLHAAPFASSSPHSSHLRKGVQSVVAHGGHSNQPVEWNQIRGPANPVSRSTSPPVEFLSPAAAITAVEAELLVLEQPLDRSLHTDGVASPAAVLPSVDLASRPAEQTEAATRAQAAGTATMSVADFDDEPQQEDFWRTPQGQLPDTVALLQFLVRLETLHMSQAPADCQQVAVGYRLSGSGSCSRSSCLACSAASILTDCTNRTVSG